MQKPITLPFSQVNREDIADVGGKGANLGEMVQSGFPVPAGFIITSQAYYKFLEENNLKSKIKETLGTISRRDSRPSDFARVSEKISDLIVKSPIPLNIKQEVVAKYDKMSSFLRKGLVAIRSSATAEDLPNASFAGQQETFLNVAGDANVLHKVRECWASLFTARAIFYREEKKFDHMKVGVAVVIQKMVQPEVSGVAFTQDPVTQDKHKMVIEAVWGLGEFAVQGTVVPDKYEVERHTLEILNIQKNEQVKQLVRVSSGSRQKPVPFHRRKKQKLSEDKIKTLARILQKIHAHYFFPQDIEWAYSKNKFYIVQARPITTLGDRNEDSDKKTKKQIKIGEVLLKGQGASFGMATGAAKLVGNPRELKKIKKGDILVASMTSPDYVPAMKMAAAIVTDEGGITSHAAIVSRELGLPCVVGTKEATKVLSDGMIITVNGKEGYVARGRVTGIGEAGIKNKDQEKVEILPKHDIKTATKLYVNLGEPELAAKTAKLPVDGVGLLRAEFIMAQIGVHPRHMIAQRRQEKFVDQLSNSLLEFTKSFDPRPVVYRTSDFKTNEYRNLDGGASYEPEEPNPMLGYRGALRYVADPDVFELELAAIKRVRENYKNLWVMIPFVRSPEQLLQVKRIMAAAGIIRSSTFKVWMMVELPVNVIRLTEFIDVGIDGVSIGSNDLTMLLLGADRDNNEVAASFNENDPAVFWALERTIKICRRKGITSSICGQAPSQNDSLVESLVRLGITSISVNPDAVGRVQRLISDTERRIATSQK